MVSKRVDKQKGVCYNSQLNTLRRLLPVKRNIPE